MFYNLALIIVVLIFSNVSSFLIWKVLMIVQITVSILIIIIIFIILFIVNDAVVAY